MYGKYGQAGGADLRGDSDEDPAMMEAQSSNVRHEPASVQEARSPFRGRPAAQILFEEFLTSLVGSNFVPSGFGFTAEENIPWIEMDTIRVGKRDTEVTLPEDPWLIRALDWVRALQAMETIKLNLSLS